MKKKIIITINIICILSVLLVFCLGIIVTRNNNYDKAEEEVKELANMLCLIYDGDLSIVNTVDNNKRVTIIDSSGVVLADSNLSDVSKMDNHIDREEIVAASKGESKVVKRKSDTMNQYMLYYAVKKSYGEDYVYIRVAVAVETVEDYVIKTIPMMIGISLLAIIASFICSKIISEKIMQPLEGIKSGLENIRNDNYEKVKTNSTYKEINELVIDINAIEENIKDIIGELEKDKEILNQVLNTINEGIVLLRNNEIILINNGAEKIFNCTSSVIGKGASALTDNIQIAQSLSSGNQIQSFECEEKDKRIICSIQKVENMVLAIFSDVTIERSSQKLRSEFFSNAGHELKTPLTSIIGFNDIIMQNDQKGVYEKYTSQIFSNSSRMLNLVNDMLKLSELENDKSTEIVEEINTKRVAEQVKNDLSVLIEKHHAKVNIEGENIVKANETHIYELIKNLMENSIKYGKENGEVKVSLYTENNNAVIKIEDDGIGIEEKHLPRIFERFYRVEKSRSRATGGTGLGLAIVKHIVLLYNGEIIVNSKVGIGTSIKISFKIQ